MVEIAKALRSRARVLILDEPTAVLSHREIDHLFMILRDLREQGMGLVYVSHRLDEIFEVCTDICVLKDGDVTSSGPIDDYDHDKVVAAMVGRSLGELFPPKSGAAADKEPVLSLRGLTAEGGAPPVDLDLRPGEIAGLAGLVGSGRTELALAIFRGGARSRDCRALWRDLRQEDAGPPVSPPAAMLTEDRKANGLFPTLRSPGISRRRRLGKGARALALLAAQRGGALAFRRRAASALSSIMWGSPYRPCRAAPAEGADRPVARE